MVTSSRPVKKRMLVIVNPYATSVSDRLRNLVVYALQGRYDVEAVSMDELVARSEVLSLHLPLTETTRGLYSPDVLDRLRRDCVLINTCRGGIVDEAALEARLRDGRTC